MFPDPILYGAIKGSRMEINKTGSKTSGMYTIIRSENTGSTDIKCVTTATYNKRRDSIDIEVVVSNSKTGEVLKTLSYQSNENDV